jgi:hypothetical protein
MKREKLNTRQLQNLCDQMDIEFPDSKIVIDVPSYDYWKEGVEMPCIYVPFSVNGESYLADVLPLTDTTVDWAY